MSNARTGLEGVMYSLFAQHEEGLTKTDGNFWYDGNNLWGWLAMISQEDHELAERVRQIFLNHSPKEAAKLIGEIHYYLYPRIKVIVLR